MHRREIGRIRPLTAPARMTMRFAPPRIAITSVEKAMKPTMNHFSFLAINGWTVLRKETEVYAAPMTDVIPAENSAMPNRR